MVGYARLFGGRCLALPARMAIARRRPDSDGITTARLAGTAGRYVSREPLDIDAALAGLWEIAGGRADLLGEVAGKALGFGPGCGRRGRSGEVAKKALKSVLLIAARAGLTNLRRSVERGQRPRPRTESR